MSVTVKWQSYREPSSALSQIEKDTSSFSRTIVLVISVMKVILNGKMPLLLYKKDALVVVWTEKVTKNSRFVANVPHCRLSQVVDLSDLTVWSLDVITHSKVWILKAYFMLHCSGCFLLLFFSLHPCQSQSRIKAIGNFPIEPSGSFYF